MHFSNMRRNEELLAEVNQNVPTESEYVNEPRHSTDPQGSNEASRDSNESSRGGTSSAAKQLEYSHHQKTASYKQINELAGENEMQSQTSNDMSENPYKDVPCALSIHRHGMP